MKEIIRRYFWAVAFFGWSIILLILAVIPSSGLIEESNDKDNFRWDYLEHFGVFVFFAILFGFWRKRQLKSANKEILMFLIFGGIYAAGTELTQLFVETRSFNHVDLALNLGGLVVGLLIVRIYVIKS